jgi:hypothetical protein
MTVNICIKYQKISTRMVQHFKPDRAGMRPLPRRGGGGGEKVSVGAITDRPWILQSKIHRRKAKTKDILLREIRKTLFFGGRSVIAPTSSKDNMVSRQPASYRVCPTTLCPRSLPAFAEFPGKRGLQWGPSYKRGNVRAMRQTENLYGDGAGGIPARPGHPAQSRPAPAEL